MGSKLTSDLEVSLKEQSRLLSEADGRLSLARAEAGRRCEREGQGRKAEALRHSLSARELWRKVQQRAMIMMRCTIVTVHYYPDIISGGRDWII